MKTRNILWGIFFICAAALVVMNQLGYFTSISLMSLVITILLLPVIAKSLVSMNFFGVFFPIGLLTIVFAKPLGIENLAFWPVLCAALFLSVGFSLIFRRKHFFSHYRKHDHFHETMENTEEGEVCFQESFGASSKYLNSTNLKKVQIHCSFGAMKVYFDSAKLSPEGTEVILDCMCSGVELYIPKEWQVVNRVETMLGGIDEKFRRGMPQTIGGATLLLTGSVRLGGVEIRYV